MISQGNETLRLGGRDVNARAYISRFNFSGTDQSKLCSVLSGGERNRLQLALALKQEGNVLLLDEPTNDIDVNTLRALEEGLEHLPAVRWLSATTAGSSTESVPTFLPSRAMVRSSSSRAAILSTKSTRRAAWAIQRSRRVAIAS